MMKNVFQLLVVANFAICVCRADLVVLRDGREYSGALVQGTESVISLQVGEDEVREFPRADVVAVHLQKKREWDAFDTVADLEDPTLNRALEIDLNTWQRRGAGTAMLHHETVVNLRTSQTWERQERQIVAVLNEHGESATIQHLLYLQDCENAEILHGAAVTTDGRILHLRDTAVKLESVYSEDARYDRLKQYRFALPEGKPGTVLDFATVKTRKSARELEHFYAEYLFGGLDPVAERTVEIIVPAGRTLRWQVLNDPDGQVSMTEEQLEEGGRRLRWERRDCPILLSEPNMPPLADVVPRLVVSAWPEEYDWKQLAQKQAEILAEKADALPSPAVPDTRPGSGRIPGLQDIWYELADTIKVTPVSVSASGWLPNAPEQTWTLRRGSQIDRTFLLFCELRKSGVDVDWGWQRSRNRGALAADVVALQAFDAPVLMVAGSRSIPIKLGDELDHFLDPLDRSGGLPMLSAKSGVEYLPVPNANEHAVDRVVHLSINENGDAEVEEEVVYTGIRAREIRSWRRSKDTDLENRVRGIVRGKFAQAEEIDWEFVGDVEDDRDRKQGLRMRYRVPELVDCRESLAVTKVPWLEFNGSSVSRESREFAMEWSEPTDNRVSVSWDTPPGWKLLSEPEVFEDDATGLAAVSAELNETDSGFRYSTEYLRSTLTVTPSEYTGFRELVERRSRLGSLYWLFTYR